MDNLDKFNKNSPYIKICSSENLDGFQEVNIENFEKSQNQERLKTIGKEQSIAANNTDSSNNCFYVRVDSSLKTGNFIKQDGNLPTDFMTGPDKVEISLQSDETGRNLHEIKDIKITTKVENNLTEFYGEDELSIAVNSIQNPPMPQTNILHPLGGQEVVTLSSQHAVDSCTGFSDSSEVKILDGDQLKRKFNCEECHAEFNSRTPYYRHKKKVHPEVYLTRPPDPNGCHYCDFRCRSNPTLIIHYKVEHSKNFEIKKIIFISEEQFKEWKSRIEKEYLSRYILTRKSRATKEAFISYYYCNRSGSFQTKGRGVKSLKIRGSLKSGQKCCSYIRKHTEKATGVIKVDYCLNHIGHELGYRLPRKIPRTQNESIRRRQIQQRHNASVKVTNIKCRISGKRWTILSENGVNAYIKRVNETCICKRVCQICKICVHIYSCTCEDYLTNCVACKHIHAVHMKQNMSEKVTIQNGSVIIESNIGMQDNNFSSKESSDGDDSEEDIHDEDIAKVLADVNKSDVRSLRSTALAMVDDVVELLNVSHNKNYLKNILDLFSAAITVGREINKKH